MDYPRRNTVRTIISGNKVTCPAGVPTVIFQAGVNVAGWDFQGRIDVQCVGGGGTQIDSVDIECSEDPGFASVNTVTTAIVIGTGFFEHFPPLVPPASYVRVTVTSAAGTAAQARSVLFGW